MRAFQQKSHLPQHSAFRCIYKLLHVHICSSLLKFIVNAHFNRTTKEKYLVNAGENDGWTK